MKRFLESPLVNAVCIGIFTAFYALVFCTSPKTAAFENNLYYTEIPSFWSSWSRFLAAGHHRAIAFALVAVTVLIVVLLAMRRRPYDEYHTAILTRCLAIAIVLTLAAIAAFYLSILHAPVGFIEKFTLFIVIHWTTVVFSDLAYVLLCRWR